jgi:hypothetical protein
MAAVTAMPARGTADGRCDRNALAFLLTIVSMYPTLTDSNSKILN